MSFRERAVAARETQIARSLRDMRKAHEQQCALAIKNALEDAQRCFPEADRYKARLIPAHGTNQEFEHHLTSVANVWVEDVPLRWWHLRGAPHRTHFRLRVPCTTCGRYVALDPREIRSTSDLGASLTEPDRAPVECDPCMYERNGLSPEDEGYPRGIPLADLDEPADPPEPLELTRTTPEV